MMLKKINKLIIRDIRKWKGEHTFEFQDGTNLIKGPNGSGKINNMAMYCSRSRSFC